MTRLCKWWRQHFVSGTIFRNVLNRAPCVVRLGEISPSSVVSLSELGFLAPPYSTPLWSQAEEHQTRCCGGGSSYREMKPALHLCQWQRRCAWLILCFVYLQQQYSHKSNNQTCLCRNVENNVILGLYYFCRWERKKERESERVCVFTVCGVLYHKKCYDLSRSMNKPLKHAEELVFFLKAHSETCKHINQSMTGHLHHLSLSFSFIQLM